MSGLVESFVQRLATVGEVGRRTPDYSLGAVILVLYPREDGLEFLATRRQPDLPQHAGQISLPGGGVREPHESPAAAALRELEEELGIPGERVRLLGSLGYFPIEFTRWDVVAHLGTWDGRDPLVRQASEVETILRVPVEDMLRQHRERFAGRRYSPAESPEYFHRQDGREFRIWGCTGRIIHHFLEAIHPPWTDAH